MFYKITEQVTVFYRSDIDSKCYQYALHELQRLMSRIGVSAEARAYKGERASFFLSLGTDSMITAPNGDLQYDGFRLVVSEVGIDLSADTAKGVLNGVYFLAEQLGFLFLLPGEAGEWAPEEVAGLPFGEKIIQPRFPYRGVFWESLSTKDYTVEEWLRFYAKLKFNALTHDNIRDLPLAEELGLRLEVGGHGLSKMLPRKLFAEKPEMFRMFQPEDFNGQRINDSNFCVTNHEAREMIKDNFREKLKSSQGAYGIHAWADDLPAGGWCLCPCCRSFSPEDQSMLAMNLLAETARECRSDLRIASIAYHDTIYPGINIRPARENFLLFAPRERCYGHAIDDPACKRNRFYLEALKAWREKFNDNHDSHTFEYYFDQILFRGMYPFLPDVILEDMNAYLENDIETHMSLQVAGPELVPEFNMLIFAEAHWNEKMTAKQFCCNISAKLAAGGAPAWEEYLMARGEIFTNVMRTCEHDIGVYLDYRWLPEATTDFAREMAEVYAESSGKLNEAAELLASKTGQDLPERLLQLTRMEVKRAKFEAEELLSMHYQQSAVNHFADYLNTGSRESSVKGCELMSRAIETLKTAKLKAMEFGLTEESWYSRNINGWLDGEFNRKIKNYNKKG